MTQRYEIEAWLGDGWTSEQVDAITERIERWERVHPDADESERGAAWSAIAQQVDGA